MKINHYFRKNTKRLFFVILTLIFLFFLFCISSYAEQLKNGSLSISSDPKGARVFLDNNFKGETPLDIKNITTGQYSLKLVLPGYQEWTSTIIILPVLTVRISADLVPKEEPDYGSISVISNPQGAKVYLDNAYKGNTPLNIRNVATGRHNIRIMLSGYEEWSRDITVSTSQVERISVDLKTQRAYGSLSIHSDPNGADIYLNDKYEGLTPLNLQNISAGTYTVKISLPGYKEWVDEVLVSASRTARVYAELKSRTDYGSISIYCDEKDAKVFLNGTYKKTITETPTVLEDVETGNYEIVIIKDGFRAWVEDIEVYFDEVTLVDATMTEIFR